MERSFVASFDADHPESLELRLALARALRAAGAHAEARTLASATAAGDGALGPGFAPELAAAEALLAAG